MGSAISRSGRGKLSLNFEGVTRRRSKGKDFRIDIMFLSRTEADDILTESSQKVGSYILYEDLDKQKMFIALKRLNGQVSHHFIHCYNDLYYFDDFPFPYIESIVLYYSKHKFKDTKFTQQAFLDPYLLTGQKSVRKQLVKSLRRSSGSTVSTSSGRIQHESSFRSVDPDKEWIHNQQTSSLESRINKDVQFRDAKKSHTSSTPNIVTGSGYPSLGALTKMYPIDYQISGDLCCKRSSTESTTTHDSQSSCRVTIDSDSGYAVSVTNSKKRCGIRDRKHKTKPRVTPEFKILTDTGEEILRTSPYLNRAKSIKNDQCYVTKL